MNRISHDAEKDMRDYNEFCVEAGGRPVSRIETRCGPDGPIDEVIRTDRTALRELGDVLYADCPDYEETRPRP